MADSRTQECRKAAGLLSQRALSCLSEFSQKDVPGRACIEVDDDAEEEALNLIRPPRDGPNSGTQAQSAPIPVPAESSSNYNVHAKVAVDSHTTGCSSVDTNDVLTRSQWQHHSSTPVLTVILLLLGLIFALGHHFYYRSLDRKPLSNFAQEWAVRIGTALAFLTQACLAASAGLAYQQHYWAILRAKPLSLQGIDSMMGLLGNPISFFCVDLWRKAWSCVCIALVIWCIPLVSIWPPASLTVDIQTHNKTTVENITTIDWAMVGVMGLFETKSGAKVYFNDAGPQTYRIVTASAYSSAIQPMQAKHQNYSYVLEFNGPALRCAPVTNQTSFEQLALAYLGASDGDNLNVTAFYNASAPFFDTLELNGENTFDLNFLTPKQNFTCETWNATYVVRFNFINGVQNVLIEKLRHENRVFPSTQGPYLYFDVTAVMGYAAWYMTLARLLQGHAVQTYTQADGQRFYQQNVTTRILELSLAGCPELSGIVITGESTRTIPDSRCPAQDLLRAIEDLSINATLSLFGSDYATFSTDPAMPGKPVDVMVSTTQLSYGYNAIALLASYFVGLATALLILGVGFYALWQNGISHISTFSSILCTTRNAELDGLALDHCLGTSPLNKSMAKQRLQFGELKQGDEASFEQQEKRGGIPHAAFGFPSTVLPLRKGQAYR